MLTLRILLGCSGVITTHRVCALVAKSRAHRYTYGSGLQYHLYWVVAWYTHMWMDLGRKQLRLRVGVFWSVDHRRWMSHVVEQVLQSRS